MTGIEQTTHQTRSGWETAVAIEVSIDCSYTEMLGSLANALQILDAHDIPRESLEMDVRADTDYEGGTIVTHRLCGSRPATAAEIADYERQQDLVRAERVRALRRQLDLLERPGDI